MSAPLEIRREASLLTVSLNRPKRRNALGPELVEALTEAVEEAERSGASLLVLRGEGPDFCAGFDLREAESLSEGDLLRRFVAIELLLARLWAAPFVTLAIGHGRVYGAGADLFACCDRRIALPDARFRFPGAAFGLILGSRRLARRVGRDAARDIIRSGREVAAAEAVERGLASDCIEGEALEALVAAEEKAAGRLDGTTRARLHAVTTEDRAALDSDLAELVRSAVQPGFRERLLAYREAALKRR